MDALTIPRLQALLRTPGQARRLAALAQLGGEQGQIAAEQLGRASLPRPEGPLVWCNLPGAIEPAALDALRARLRVDRPGLSLLVSSPDAARCAKRSDAANLLCQQVPLDSPRTCVRFLDHWAPDIGIWFDRIESPVLLEEAARRGVPLFMQNAVAPTNDVPRARNLERRLLGLFERILAVDSTEAAGIRALGAIPARVESTGRLAPIAHPPHCVEAERQALAEAIGGRPVWLAMCPDESEIDAILAAHETARRTAHRLLLLLVPRREADGPGLAERLRQAGWAVARREAYEDPDERTDVLIGDWLDEIGLYYRIAPVTFLGGTLSDTEVMPAIHPATLGSAIIAGPFSGGEAETLRRLRRGGACRLIVDGERLGLAVSELLAPDRAAQLALNAWAIASDGSIVLDRLANLVLAAMRGRSG